MAWRNYPLMIGVVLSVLMLSLAVFGPLFARHDPLEQFKYLAYNDQFYGNVPFQVLPPFVHPDFPLGWDVGRRDLLSRLLWAVRPTIVLCVITMAVRIVIGVVLGVLAGWFGGRLSQFLDMLVSVAVALPALLFAVAVLLAVGIERGLLAYVVALTLGGWVDTSLLVRSRVQSVLGALYIESARSIGLRPFQIMTRHVLPQLMPILPLMMAFEMSAVLLLVAEMGYLGYFIGGGFVSVYFLNSDFVPIREIMAGAPELGQMLSGFFPQLYDAPWVSVFTGMLIFLTLAAFSLLGEGLRRQLDVTRPRAIGWWRRWLAPPARNAQHGTASGR